MALTQIKSTIKGNGLAIGAKKAATQYLVEHITFNTTSSTNVTGELGLADLTPVTPPLDAATHTDNPGSVTNKASVDRLRDEGTVPLDFAAAANSFIISFSVYVPVAAGATETDLLAIYDVLTVRGIRVTVLLDGTVRFRHVSSAGSTHLTTVAVIDDAAWHTFVGYIDKNTNKMVWRMDGVELSTTSANFALDAVGTAADLCVFCRGNVMTSSNQLYAEHPDAAIMDLQLYKITGNLPSNIDTALVPWLERHTNYPVPAELW